MSTRKRCVNIFNEFWFRSITENIRNRMESMQIDRMLLLFWIRATTQTKNSRREKTWFIWKKNQKLKVCCTVTKIRKEREPKSSWRTDSNVNGKHRFFDTNDSMYSNFSLNYPMKLEPNEFVNIPRICFPSDICIGCVWCANRSCNNASLTLQPSSKTQFENERKVRMLGKKAIRFFFSCRIDKSYL